MASKFQPEQNLEELQAAESLYAPAWRKRGVFHVEHLLHHPGRCLDETCLLTNLVP